MQKKGVQRRFLFLLLLVLSLVLISPGLEQKAYASVQEALDIDDVWSVHLTGRPVLITQNDYMFVAYYDTDLYLKIAQRRLDSSTWTYFKTTIQSNWEAGDHHAIAFGIDENGILHVAAAMHAEPLKYYRSTVPYDVSSLTRYDTMLGVDEIQVTYPNFFMNANNELHFIYRSGKSGSGNTIINKWDADTLSWSRVTSAPLFAGGSESAYNSVPTLGPDGKFHIVYMWRVSSDAATNHDLSYISSTDLVNWKNADGDPVTLPLTPSNNSTVIDPVPVGHGLVNTSYKLGFDAQNRPLVTYHKYDENGKSQVYLARYENGDWNIVRLTDWSYRWQFGGTGNFPTNVAVGFPYADTDGYIKVRYIHAAYGEARIIVDPITLQPVGQTLKDDYTRYWPIEIDFPESSFTNFKMGVEWRDNWSDGAYVTPVITGTQYKLRWERGPSNGDKPVAQPWPEPTKLRVYKIDSTIVPNPQPIRYEAENMAISGFIVENNAASSGGKCLKNTTYNPADATFQFNGDSGIYNIKVGYFDENDGVSTYTLYLNGVPLTTWSADFDLGYNSAVSQTLIRKEVTGVMINKGAVIKVESINHTGENGRVDYVELTPMKAVTTLVNENFDGMTTGIKPSDGWTTATSGGTVTVESDPLTSGKSVKLNDTNTSYEVGLMKSFAAQTGTVTAEFNVLFKDTQPSYFKFYSGSGEAVRIKADGTNLLYRDGAAYVPMQSYTQDKWYRFKLIINVATNKCDVFVDGVKLISQLDFMNPASNLTFFKANTQDDRTAEVYVDNVLIY